MERALGGLAAKVERDGTGGRGDYAPCLSINTAHFSDEFRQNSARIRGGVLEAVESLHLFEECTHERRALQSVVCNVQFTAGLQSCVHRGEASAFVTKRNLME